MSGSFPPSGWLCPAGFLPVAGCVRQSPSGGWLCPAVFSQRLVPSYRLPFERLVPSYRLPFERLVLSYRLPFERMVLSFRLLFEQLVLSYRLPFERLVLSYRLPFRRLFCPRFYLPNSSFICLRVYCQRLWCHTVYRLNGWFCVRFDPSSRFARGL